MRTRIGVVTVVLTCLIAMSVYATEEATTETAAVSEPAATTETAQAASLETEMEKISYIIGTQLAGSIRRAGVEVDVDALISGLTDALTGQKPAMSQTEMKTVYDAWLKRRKEEQAAAQARIASENLAKGAAFLEANKAKEGVVVLPSGLQYKVITEGTGKTPVATDWVRANYRGTLIDGTEFDSSKRHGKPGEFAVTRVIPGWTEALQIMKEGDKWELYIPANLAYKELGSPPRIPPNSTLIFEIELLKIIDPPKPATTVRPGGTVKPAETDNK